MGRLYPGELLPGRECDRTDLREDEMEARNHADVGGDERNNLARVLNNALREADACGGYALEA